VSDQTPNELYARYRAALAGEPLPAALVDLDAVDANVGLLLAPLRGGAKRLRVATKSVRCPALLRHVLARGGDLVRGLMTYTAAETAFLAAEGFDDLLLAYPTAQPADADLLAAANRRTRAAVVVDSARHLEVLEAGARAAGVTIPVVVEADLAYRPLGAAVHVGVRRSPLHEIADVVAFVRSIAAYPHLDFLGLMGYEAHLAGIPDLDRAARLMKALARPAVERQRARLVEALISAGLAPRLFNGAGTGSLAAASREAALTEVTAGSGFLASHLFDHYEGLPLRPAAFFALQVVREPAPGLVTCLGGGYVASGAAGPDRLPVPALPAGARLLDLEGAGEVQTPVRLPAGVRLRPGDPLFFRHAKAGELAEHFAEYLLVRGRKVVERAPTYRGCGRCFLG
jgi:D-serine deaminase-like pyridoxal phosphate-dependent protein